MSYVVIATMKEEAKRFHVAVGMSEPCTPYVDGDDAIHAACCVAGEYLVRVVSLEEMALAWCEKNDIDTTECSVLEVQTGSLPQFQDDDIA